MLHFLAIFCCTSCMMQQQKNGGKGKGTKAMEARKNVVYNKQQGKIEVFRIYGRRQKSDVGLMDFYGLKMVSLYLL